MTKSPDFTIRDATPADAEAVIRMHAQSWLDTYPNAEYGVTEEWVRARTDSWLTPERLESRRDRIREALESPDMMYKIALDEKGVVIGFACPFREEGQQRVGGLYVDKTYQGFGLAQVLMDEIIDWADPGHPLTLEVASYNERAKRFYEKYDFKEVEDSSEHYKGTIPIVTMIRKGDKQ